jgi:PPOX class probable F420-dependent enzyme
MTVTFNDIAAAKHVLLTTFRKNGTAVSTPLWAVRDGQRLLMWTVTDSYKVKRLRRDPRARLAICDVRGNPKSEAIDATGVILDDEGTERVRKLLGKKYGIAGKIAVKASLLRRGRHGTVGLAFTPVQ